MIWERKRRSNSAPEPQYFRVNGITPELIVQAGRMGLRFDVTSLIGPYPELTITLTAIGQDYDYWWGGAHYWGSFASISGGGPSLTLTVTSLENRLQIPEAETDKKEPYALNEEVLISCRVRDEKTGIAISTATVKAEIIKPDGSRETITLLETEPGTYEGSFSDTSLEGTYNVIITAEKEDYTGDVTGIFFDVEIPKIPLGGGESGKGDGATYKIYVPTRWGGTLTVTDTTGKVGLYYPDPQTNIASPKAVNEYEVPLDKHGWYYVKHHGEGSFTIENTFVQEGEADKRPWNFWYYPYLRYTYLENGRPKMNLYNPGGVLDKYDQIFQTESRRYEEEHYSTTDPDKFWWGHCLGGAIASILLGQPEAVVYSGQSFNQEEMEGLVIKLANTYNVDGEILAGPIPSIKPESGKDDTDEFADDFHVGLVNYLRIPKERKSLYSNLRDPKVRIPEAVWNHAIYKYKSVMQEAKEGEESIIKITTTINANADVFPSDNIVDRIEKYVYKLKYKPNGEIDDKFIGQDWISASGFTPGKLSLITGCRFDNNRSNNPYVRKENVEKLGIQFP